MSQLAKISGNGLSAGVHDSGNVYASFHATGREVTFTASHYSNRDEGRTDFFTLVMKSEHDEFTAYMSGAQIDEVIEALQKAKSEAEAEQAAATREVA